MGAADVHDGYAEANSRLIRFLKDLNQELQVPSLAEFGAEHAEFEACVVTMCEQAFASGSPSNNPRVPNQEEMLALYRSLWATVTSH